MIDKTICVLIDSPRVRKIPVGCPVESDTVINVSEVDGVRTAIPYSPGSGHYFTGAFLQVGYVRVGPKGKRKAVRVARVWEKLHRRIVAVPIDGLRIRLSTAQTMIDAIKSMVGRTA